MPWRKEQISLQVLQSCKSWCLWRVTNYLRKERNQGSKMFHSLVGAVASSLLSLLGQNVGMTERYARWKIKCPIRAQESYSDLVFLQKYAGYFFTERNAKIGCQDKQNLKNAECKKCIQTALLKCSLEKEIFTLIRKTGHVQI